MTVAVVLVDDLEEARRLVRTALRFRPGYQVVGEARTGAEAIALAERLQPEIVVLDLGLPDLAGEEVLTQIRRVAPDSQVIVFTGRVLDDTAWFEEHATPLVSKEHLDRLVDVVESLAPPHAATTSLSITLPCEPSSPGRARSEARTALSGWGLDHLADVVVLVVSELTTNAVEHARTDFQLTMSQVEDQTERIRIEVHDGGTGSPDLGDGGDSSERGRGLLIVSAISEAWGIATEGDRKMVWAELGPTGRGL